ncbi:hypothetical protein Amsp01_011260 [Amycolatopsis sp. NBRC 101858]|uniref:hypothetical protein n=1 Tax=Amycolatopsis sp. NBRC 101858 TaxID=3032200 RepID=UPI0024A32354|nr:hypothetical protein [Amycolatopsis sp. NBRC 101858]GLY35102.1 hypothetical protein Amsp01_011260 [Amycolatopsis sp. NBRC 101858]
MIDDSALEAAKLRLADGVPLDAVLADLREGGASPVDSIRAVRVLTAASLAEAKEIVHVSPAWADTRERHDELHRSLEQDLSRDR